MSLSKAAYVAHVPGHKNSEGKSAPWVIKDHKNDHIISSFGSEAEAKAGLRNMHAHEGSLKTAAIPLEELAAGARSPEEGREAFRRRRDYGKTAGVTFNGLDEFTRAYIEAALWSSMDDEGDPLDAKYRFDDLAPSTLKVMIDDCKKFQNENKEALTEKGLSQGGHDFWLTRSGHGSGFWDGDWPDNGKVLTLASKKFKEPELYVGDDGYIYQGGSEGDVPVPPRDGYEFTDKDRAALKEMGVVAAKIENPLLHRASQKLAFDFDSNHPRQYDYESDGNNVILISPSNVTKMLVGDEANEFWTKLDHIDTQSGDSEEEYQYGVEATVGSYFDKEAKTASMKYIIKVNATSIKKGSVTFISGVEYHGTKVEKLKFTNNQIKATKFSRSEALKISAKLKDFKLTGLLLGEDGR